MGAEVVYSRRVARIGRHHERLDGLSPSRVGHAEDRRLTNAGMLL
jgi:hypothetical protein